MCSQFLKHRTLEQNTWGWAVKEKGNSSSYYPDFLKTAGQNLVMPSPNLRTVFMDSIHGRSSSPYQIHTWTMSANQVFTTVWPPPPEGQTTQESAGTDRKILFRCLCLDSHKLARSSTWTGFLLANYDRKALPMWILWCVVRLQHFFPCMNLSMYS